MVQNHSWQGRILLQRRFGHLYPHPHRAASRCRWLLPTPEEILHDAQIHAWPLLGQIRMVYEGWRRRLHQRGQTGALPQEPEQQRAPVPGADRPRHHGGDGEAGTGTRRELLHGGARSDHEPGGAAEDGAPHWRVPAGDVHHARGRGSGEMRAEVRGGAVCLVLRGKDEECGMGKCLLWEVGGRVAVVHSSSPRPHLPLQLDHPTVGFLCFSFPASVTLGKTYKNLEMQQ